jgi:environmental stress-induced protein Ves
VDFNLMADPTRCRAQLEAGTLDRPRRLVLDAPTVLIFVAWGTVSVPALDLHLGQGHLLRLEQGMGALELLPGYGGGAMVVVRVA